MRLIDVDVLLGPMKLQKEALDKIAPKAVVKWYDYAIWEIQQAPTIDAEPVKQGKWTDKKVVDDIKLPQMQEAKCSVCGKYLSTPYVYYWTTYKYCPHCGAKMEVGE